MEKPESPILEKEAAHLGRAAQDMGFKTFDEYIANLYERLFKFSEQADAYNKAREKEKEGSKEE